MTSQVRQAAVIASNAKQPRRQIAFATLDAAVARIGQRNHHDAIDSLSTTVIAGTRLLRCARNDGHLPPQRSAAC